MRTTPMTRRAAALAAALALAAVPAGCGGDDEEGAGGGGGGGAEATQTATPEGGGGGADRGQQLFTTTCGGCHALSAAGTSGSVGPNLDDVEPDRDQVLGAIAQGPGQMPENLLQGADAEAVADYVSQNAGQ